MEDPLPAPHYAVGLAYNLKRGIKSDVEDIEAEYDSIDTVNAIKDALERLGCKVELLEADKDIIKKLQRSKIDIVFNIAEGLQGRGREAHIPALLSFLGIPFTGSDETTLCIALDKGLTKRILTTHRIRTPKYQVVDDSRDSIKSGLKYPLIVKPNTEGSSKGISDLATVCDRKQLEVIIKKDFEMYNQPMLVEEFISGREFTVGVLGNGGETIVFPPMEVKYKDKGRKHNIYSFDVKKNFRQLIEYECPAALEKRLESQITDIAGKIYSILKCKDFSRMDFRLSEKGEIYFIEINPLPGLAPGYSDYIMIAEFNGLDYTSVIKNVLNSALKRYCMKLIN